MKFHEIVFLRHGAFLEINAFMVAVLIGAEEGMTLTTSQR